MYFIIYIEAGIIFSVYEYCAGYTLDEHEIIVGFQAVTSFFTKVSVPALRTGGTVAGTCS